MRLPRLSVLLFLFPFFLSAFSHEDEILLEKKLKKLPGVSFKKNLKTNSLLLQYDLLITQPIDHLHPEKGSFRQRVQLTHKGFTNATVMETQGYWLDYNRNEIEKTFTANNLNIEYRFYGNSRPDSIPWSYLTLEQATADLHHINTLFRTIYNGKWISTGASKGGQTTIFYKYFYPDDIDLAIPYVAPINNSLEDKRIYNFLDTIGTTECRNQIFQLQLYLLKHENEALKKLERDKKAKAEHFSYLGGPGKAYELAVFEFSFTFWQQGYSCRAIPDTSSFEKCFDYLNSVCPVTFWSDQSMTAFAPHYYQSATQTGYYGYNIEPFKNYTRHFKDNPSAIFPPKGVAITYTDCSLTLALQKWLSDKGNNFIYIYGGIDTWSACRVSVSDNVNSKCFLLPGQSHATATLKNMPAEMRKEFADFVKRQTGIVVDYDVL